MAQTFSGDVYRSSKTLSNVTMGLLSSLVVCAILYTIFCLMMMFFPGAQIDLGKGDTLHIGLGLIGLVGLLEIPLRLLTIIFFLLWEHRAFSNLSALKARNLDFSPGWAVGWWFIPFLNLFKPFQVMRELWNESDPDFDAETGFLNSASGAPPVMSFWWAFFIIAGLFGNVANNVADAEGDAADYFPSAFLVASLFQIAAAVSAVYIVKNITRRQEERFQKLGNSGQYAPPTPPTFNEADQVI